MNTFIKKTILLVYSFMITYIIASVIIWDLNIAHWSSAVRFIWIIFSLGIFATGVSKHNLNN
jgi:hypothetical protein